MHTFSIILKCFRAFNMFRKNRFYYKIYYWILGILLQTQINVGVYKVDLGVLEVNFGVCGVDFKITRVDLRVLKVDWEICLNLGIWLTFWAKLVQKKS